MAHYNLDSLDKKILKLIAKDARIPFLEVARLCNVSVQLFISAYRSSPISVCSKGRSLSSTQRCLVTRRALTSDSICRTLLRSTMWLRS